MVPHLLLLFPSVLAVSWSHQPWSPVSPTGLLLPPVTGSGPPVVPPGPRSLPLVAPHRQTPPRLPGVLGRRRKWRRRRRYWRDPRAYQRFRGVRLLRETVVPRTRRRQQRREDDGEGRGFVSSFRNLFGAPDHCLEEGRQYSCTFAPVCWLTGGVATPGNPELRLLVVYLFLSL